jgi:hypothetical protein
MHRRLPRGSRKCVGHSCKCVGRAAKSDTIHRKSSSASWTLSVSRILSRVSGRFTACCSTLNMCFPPGMGKAICRSSPNSFCQSRRVDRVVERGMLRIVTSCAAFNGVSSMVLATVSTTQPKITFLVCQALSLFLRSLPLRTECAIPVRDDCGPLELLP